MSINQELFQNHFSFQMLSAMVSSLYYRDKEKNKELVTVTKSGLKELKDEIKQMSKDELKMKSHIK